MIYLTLEGLNIKIDTTDRTSLVLIKNHFTYKVPECKFMPLYKSGVWDGKICLFDTVHRKLPYGLLFDLIKVLKIGRQEISASDEMKLLFKDKSFNKDDIKWDLKYQPRYYQKEIIEKALLFKKGLLISPTASGKSICIAYIINELIRKKKTKKSLIVVPTTSLIWQFYDHMIEYGIDENLIGKFYADSKDWDKPVLISTWQSLTVNNENLRKSEMRSIKKELKKKKISEEDKEKFQNRLKILMADDYIKNVKRLNEQRSDLLESIDTIIVDEVQIGKSKMVSELLQKCYNAHYRYGFTGTLQESILDINQIKSYLGPIIKEYSVNELTKNGFVNPCNVNIINIQYKQSIKGKINEVKDILFENEFRNNLLCSLIKPPQNYLFLVSRIEKEGIILEKLFKERFPDYEVKFINSNIPVQEREKWRLKCKNEEKIILVAIYSIFQAGVDIDTLQNVVLVSSFKSKVRILQSIGRSLRKAQTKGTSQIFDIVDRNNKYLPAHARERIRLYENEQFNITYHNYKEGEVIFPIN